MNRRAYVAGHFYPRNSASLTEELEGYLKNTPEPKGSVLGIIAPHAGYQFSGQCAAHAYKAISNRKIKYAVVIAPSHHSNQIPFSVGDYQFYETPIGKVSVDRKRVETLLENDLFAFEPQLHEREHSLEVQLPFVRKVLPDAKILPILFGTQTLSNSKILADCLLDLYANELDDVVFIISTDLSHYFPAELAEKKDKRFIESVLSGDPEKLWETMRNGKCEACGIGGVLVLMHIARKLGNKKFRELCYYHSGFINQDRDKVVGYVSISMES
ncbi:MAG: AmmeMemoRadiSam system protein B [Candidatus Zophobacter franzmannii]|jgi:AmmeMemoRadiSam system protein B|nr:AmmeMemoRadiSam system protein B [Candidatus Zophobacter franzmannii]